MNYGTKQIIKLAAKFEAKSEELRKAAMAFDREQYINHITQVLIGAAKEYFKIVLSQKTKEGVRYQSAWQAEVDQHLNQALDARINDIVKFNNKNRAILESFKELDGDMKRQITRACNEFAEYYPNWTFNKLKRLIDQSDIDAFVIDAKKKALKHLGMSYPPKDKK